LAGTARAGRHSLVVIMATQKILMVQYDTRPDLVLSLTDERTGQPFDLSVPDIYIFIRLREIGAQTTSLYGYANPIAGRVNSDTDDIDIQPPYDVAGRGGRCVMKWENMGMLSTGEYEAEVTVYFPHGQQTAYNLLRISVRERFE